MLNKIFYRHEFNWTTILYDAKQNSLFIKKLLFQTKIFNKKNVKDDGKDYLNSNLEQQHTACQEHDMVGTQSCIGQSPFLQYILPSSRWKLPLPIGWRQLTQTKQLTWKVFFKALTTSCYNTLNHLPL